MILFIIIPYFFVMLLSQSLPSSYLVNDNGIIKSDKDKCNYDHLILPNGLEVLLIQDPDTDKASAAMNVKCGYFHDPKEIPGLAHFLEHLLFMGTTRFPDENGYSKFLSEHGGHANAFTSEEHTNYFFEINHEFLEQALERFSGFFIDPLFKSDCIGREMNAVDSEHKKNILNDVWRLSQLEKYLSDPNHPYSHFGTGNLNTLKRSDIRNTTIELFDKFYLAGNMKLVIYGKEISETLKSWAIKYFSKIQKMTTEMEHSIKDDYGLPWKEEHSMKQIHVKTLKNMRRIYLTWLLPSMRPFFRTKPEHYFSHLMGHEGPGSIFSILHGKGWITELSCGVDCDTSSHSFLQMAMELTLEGFQNFQEIISLVFEYLMMTMQKGPQIEIFSENRIINEYKFRFSENPTPIALTHKYSYALHKYPLSHVLIGQILVEEFDIGKINWLVGQLLEAKNFRVILASKEEENSNWNIEPWYGTEYKIGDLSLNFLNNTRNITNIRHDMFLPSFNEFMVSDFETRTLISSSSSSQSKNIPLLLKKSNNIKLWYKEGLNNTCPKGSVHMIMRNEFILSSPKAFVSGYLFSELLMDRLMIELYDAKIAGLSYSIELRNEGLVIKVSGFSEHLIKLMIRILKSIMESSFNPLRFNIIKERYKKWLKNTFYESPIWQTNFFLLNILEKKNIWIDEKLSCLDKVYLDDCTKWGKNFVQSTSIDCLVHGNLSKKVFVCFFRSLRNFLRI